MTEQVLDGLQVVEVGQYVAAPLAGSIFADLGAQVVKVERPGGDPLALRSGPLRRLEPGQGVGRARLAHRRGPSRGARPARRGRPAGREPAARSVGAPRPGARHAASRTRPKLVTCSISAWGSTGPARDEPGWEPLVHARAGAQQGCSRVTTPCGCPSPWPAWRPRCWPSSARAPRWSSGPRPVTASTSRPPCSTGCCSSTRRRSSTARGTGPAVVRQTKSPILRVFETADGRAVMVNLSGTERWRELCRLLGMDDGGLDYATPEGLSKLSDREWNRVVLKRMIERLREQDRGRVGGGAARAAGAVAKCNTLAEWLAHEQARTEELVVETEDPTLGRVPLVGPPVRIGSDPGRAAARPPARLGARRARRPPHGRPLQLLGRTPGGAPAGRARGRRGEGGAARRRGRVPAHARAAQHLRGRNRSKRGLVLDLQDGRGPGPAARPRGRVRRRGRERDGGRLGASGAR